MAGQKAPWGQQEAATGNGFPGHAVPARGPAPPALSRRPKLHPALGTRGKLSWQTAIVALLSVHVCFLVVVAHRHTAEAYGMGLPGFQLAWRQHSAGEPIRAGAGGHGGISDQLSAAAAPLRRCPVEVEWGKMRGDPNLNRAAVWTRYNIVMGGGERYLLSVVSVMQDMGYSVDVLVRHDNECQTTDFLLNTARQLRIQLDPARVAVKAVDIHNLHLQVPEGVYSIFFCMGNEKVPQVRGVGAVSLFHSQFPFDGYEAVTAAQMEALSTYDYVILNSGFTYRWWTTYTGGWYYPSLQRQGLMPTPEVLHPPVDVFPPDALDDLGAVHRGQAQAALGAGGGSKRRHIALIGRFFLGRQSKGHGEAVELFRSILPSLPLGTELHLIGNLMNGAPHEGYLQGVKQKAEGLPVTFHVSAPTADVEAVLHSALVQWHLTGVGLKPGEDPGNEEHFGISVAEGMSAGAIPVVLLRGGVQDIVRQGVNGFLAPDLAELGRRTLKVFNMSTAEVAAMRTQAIRDVAQFTHATFAKRFKAIVQRGAYAKPFRHLVNDTRDVVNSRSFELPPESDHLALIILPERHYAFEYVVKSLLFHLTSSSGGAGVGHRGVSGAGEPAWVLVVVHGLNNKGFVARALRDVRGVQLWEEASPARLLEGPEELWERPALLATKKVLLFSVDTLLLRGGLADFLPFDYIAAPACGAGVAGSNATNGRVVSPLLDPGASEALYGTVAATGPGGSFSGAGVGVLSLHSVAAQREVATQQANAVRAGLSLAQQVDLFGAAGAWSPYAVPRQAVAYRFAVGAPCPELEAGFTPKYGHPLHSLPHVPLGLQATWYHFWDDKQRYRDLLKLLELSVCGYGGG